MEPEQILRFAPFSSAKGETAADLVSSVSLYRLDAGETIECGAALGVVLYGEIAVKGLNGGRRVIYRTIPKGETFGAAQIFGGDGAFTQLTARNGCEIAVIPEEAIRKAISRDGGFALAFTEMLCGKLRILNRKLAEFTAPDAAAAVCKALLGMSKQEKTSVAIKSRAEFAASLGMSRMTLYRVLEALEKSGAVSLCEKEIIIEDIDLLKSMI